MIKYYLTTDIDEIVQRVKFDVIQFSGKRILLTGGLGFLGRYFIEIFRKLNNEVLEKPAKVVVLDNMITSGDINDFRVNDSNIEIINHDVTKPFDYDRTINYIIHAAGIASPQYYQKYSLETLEVAVTGTKNMLQMALKHKAKFTFFSSSEIYGNPDGEHIPTNEDYKGSVSTLGPRSCYDEGKRVGETLCYIYNKHFKVHTTIVRPFNLFGPGMQETDYRVLPNFASRIKVKKPLRVYGTGNQTRTFCYIVDAMTGLFKVILKGISGEVYNIGTSKPEISMVELVKVITQILGHEVTCEIVKYPQIYPADEPIRRCPDIRKAQLQLGYEPKITLEEGLYRFFSWANENYNGVQ